MSAGVSAVLRKLEAFPVEEFAGDVFRVTSLGSDPLAPSVNGGRWAPPRPPVAETSDYATRAGNALRDRLVDRWIASLHWQ